MGIRAKPGALWTTGSLEQGTEPGETTLERSLKRKKEKKKVLIVTSTANQTKLVGFYNTQASRCVAQLLLVILRGAARANQHDI